MRLPLLFLVSGALVAGYAQRPWRLVVRNRLLLFGWLLVVWLLVERQVLAFLGAKDVPRLRDAARHVGENFWLPEDYLWFIWALGVMSVLARLLVRAPWVLAAMALLSMSGLLDGAAETLHLGKQTTQPVHTAPLFLLGFVLSSVLLRWGQRLGWAVTLAAAALFGLATWAARSTERGELVPDRLVALALVVVGVPALLGVAHLMSLSPARRPLTALGRRTLPVSVTHMPVLLSCLGVVQMHPELLARSQAHPYVLVVVVFGVAAGAGLALWWITTALQIRGVYDTPAWLLRCLDRVAPPPPRHPTPRPPTTTHGSSASVQDLATTSA